MNAAAQAADSRRAPADQARRVPVVEAGTWLTLADDGLTRCPLCFGAMEPAPGMAGFVRHKNARRAAQCVLTTSHYQPDDLAVRRVANPALSALNRRRFVECWEFHYALVRQMWPGITIQRFINMLALADVLGLWSYAGLRDDDLAAVLLVLTGFIKVRPGDGLPIALPVAPSTKPGAEAAAVTERPRGTTTNWVRFWFDSSVHDVGDLWMPRDRPAELFRVDYREADATPFPTGNEVLRCERVAGVREAWAARGEGSAQTIDAAERHAFLSFASRTHALGGADSSVASKRQGSKGGG
ncbi:hypothetical protein [Paraburkholderia sp. ZP32-5]|uniref:hypothetical protein n=1 Tax=Paraburkholderia sp. ZP32-5 TaxID=2883245 RepID=UPI001F417599|nr:hypothetical protein [Paraburkholderia sp. ZP32-5]